MRYKSKEHFAEELAKAIGTDILNKVESLKKAWLKPGQEHLTGMLDDKGNLRPVAQPMLAGHDPGNASSASSASSGTQLASMFRDLKHAQNQGDAAASQQHVDRIKSHLNNEHPGSVDVGALSRLHEANHTDSNLLPRFSDKDFLEAADKHLDGVRSLKDVYDRHGMDAVKSIARAHGVNVDPYHHEQSGYATPLHEHRNLKHLIGDTQAFVMGKYGNHSTRHYGAQVDHNMYYDQSPGNRPSSTQRDSLHKEVEKAWEDAMDSDDGFDNAKSFERAVINRGEHDFKTAHKIK